MKPSDQWNDTGFCFRNAKVLRDVGMTAAAAVWQERAESLMQAQFAGKGVLDEFMADLTRGRG